eukprot:gene10680-1943_t
MSQHLESMKIGQTLSVRGPVGYDFLVVRWKNESKNLKNSHIVYRGRGRFELTDIQKKAHVTHIGMLAGGTG